MDIVKAVQMYEADLPADVKDCTAQLTQVMQAEPSGDQFSHLIACLMLGEAIVKPVDDVNAQSMQLYKYMSSTLRVKTDLPTKASHGTISLHKRTPI